MMQYCSHCGVYIRGAKGRCVLCGNTLPASGADTGQLYPQIPPAYQNHLVLRVLVFISLSIIVASFTIRAIIPTNINWPVFVLFGFISLWIDLIVILKKRHDVPKTILWQVSIVSLLSVFWDWQIGWRGWSLDFIIPIISATAVIIMFITARILKISSRDYITYAVLDCLLGIFSATFLIFHWVKTPYPSILCVAVNIIFLSAIFIFEDSNIKRELNRKMHF